jgi:hypothetical protein
MALIYMHTRDARKNVSNKHTQLSTNLGMGDGHEKRARVGCGKLAVVLALLGDVVLVSAVF